MLVFKMNMPFHLMMLYGSIMILIVLLLRGILRNRLPKFVFPALWGVVILRLLIPFSLSSPLSIRIPESLLDFSIHLPSEAITQTTIAMEAVVIEDAQEEAVAGTDTNDKSGYIPTEPIIESVAESAPETVYFNEYEISSFYPVLLFAAFSGIIVTACIMLLQKYKCTKRLKDSLLIEHNETINTLLRDMDMGHILVFTNDEIASPLVCGLLSPKIYLPTRMDFANTELLRHILCHETMHIRRHDNWMKCAMLVTLCVHWFNPLAWIMSKCLSSDLEAACDEAVLRFYHDEEAGKSYALCLLAMAVTGNRQTLLYSAFSKTEVEKRIKNIVHYRKASVLMLMFSLLFVLSGSVVFATGGQAPYSQYLSFFCGSDTCRWGFQAFLTRDIALGKNASERADNVIFNVMADDTTNDPDILESRIKTALAGEFHVEPDAFRLDTMLCLDREQLFAEYEKWGLVRKDKDNDTMLYNGETIRTYSDKILGRYQSQQEGSVDITVVRDRLGYITSVTAFHEGDAEFDRRTRDITRGMYRAYSSVSGTPEVTYHSYQTYSEAEELR